MVISEMPDVNNYNRAREFIVDYYSRVVDVLLVCEYGTVHCPGLSDLDIMVVLKDDPISEDLNNELTIKGIPSQIFWIRDISRESALPLPRGRWQGHKPPVLN